MGRPSQFRPPPSRVRNSLRLHSWRRSRGPAKAGHYGRTRRSDTAKTRRFGNIAPLMTWISELAPALIDRFGSPLYVYNADLVETAYTRFRNAFPYDPTELHYAIVCNKNPFIVRLVHALGAGVHANTPGDAFAALRAGVPAGRILYSGTNLNAADLEWLDAHAIQMNLDSLHQLRDAIARTRRTSFGLRMLIDAERSGNRIGVTLEELPTAVQLTQAAGKRLAGLHMYAGTNTLRASRFLECFDRLVKGAELLPDLEYLDVGGGFG